MRRVTGCAEHHRAGLVGRRQPEGDELHTHTREQQRERQPHKRAAKQYSRLLADDRLNRADGQQRQGDACTEHRHDVKLRAKCTPGEHRLGARRQHLAEDTDKRGSSARDPHQQAVEEPTEERLGERVHKSGTSDASEDTSDRVGQCPDGALDRSEDTGDPTATAGAGRAWDARHHGETVDVAKQRQTMRMVSGSHGRSGTRSSRASVRPR